MSAGPPIVSRSAWGANPLATPASSIATPAPDLWLHHTASDGLHGASGMRSLQANARNGGYVDLEYTYVVDTDGTVYESRGPGRNTAATGGSTGGQANNSRSHAICVMGNFEPAAGGRATPSSHLLDVLAQLVRWMHESGWSPASITGPHTAAPGNSTACCGSTLIAQIPEINRRAASGVTPTEPDTTTGGAMEICRTPSGKGYYIVADDGGVFCYGDAAFHGSMGGQKLNAPVVGMAVRPKGDGYVLVAADGGVFCFGKATYLGGMGGQKLNAPITDVEYDAEGDGYWMLAQDGGVFAFGKTTFYGAPTGKV